MFDHLQLHCILFLSENILNQSSILQFLSEFRLILYHSTPFLYLFFFIEVIAAPSQDNDSKNSNFLDIKDDLDMLEKRTYNLLQVIEHLHFFPFHFISFHFNLLYYFLFWILQYFKIYFVFLTILILIFIPSFIILNYNFSSSIFFFQTDDTT